MANSEDKFLLLRTSSDGYHTSYLELADHPHQSVHCVYKTVLLHQLVEPYDGPMIAIDFDEHHRPIGIEIIYSYSDSDVAVE